MSTDDEVCKGKRHHSYGLLEYQGHLQGRGIKMSQGFANMRFSESWHNTYAVISSFHDSREPSRSARTSTT